MLNRLLSGIVLFIGFSVAFAQGAWPSRPLRIVVPFAPGGSADLTARTVGQKLGDLLGQSVIVDNRPGANGANGTDFVAKSAPDGYTIVCTDRGALAINPALYSRLPYDSVKDFEHIGIATLGLYLLVVNREMPARNFAEFVALAQAKPGLLNYASIGIGSVTHLSFESLKAHFKIDVTHVPYKGTAPAAAAAVSGEAQATMSTPNAVQGFIKDGRLRPLVFGSPRRSALFPDVPSIVEVGGLPETIVPGFFSFSAPAGTPKAIVTRLSEEIARVLRQPDVAERLTRAGLEPHGGTPQELTDTVKADIVRFAQIVRTIGIKPE